MANEPEFLTELAQAATQMHELFMAYINAGFTEQQALYLVGRMVTRPPELGGD